MKQITLCWFITTCILGCGQKLDNVTLVESFERHYNEKNESEMLDLISDDFKIDYQSEIVEIDGKNEFLVALNWGKIMNAKNETTIISKTRNQVIATEKYINDKNKLLEIPSMELKATYFIKRGKISGISLDTLDTGRSKIDANRNTKLKLFKDWCNSTMGYSEFKLTEEGAIKLKNALISYSKK